MPIIETVASETPIGQGDILQHIPLYRTVVSDGESKSVRSTTPLSMVVSRTCNIAHKDDLLLAEIVKFKQSMPTGVESFEQALDFFKTQRDGVESPDCFYLGEIPNHSGRFVAKLDSLYTVSVSDKVKLRESRIACLNLDFQRDLHLRVFNAVASFGFEDEDWLPTADLKFLKTIGEAQLAKLVSDASKERASKAKQDFNSGKFSEKNLNDLEKTILDLKSAMAPFLAKLDQRLNIDLT